MKGIPLRCLKGELRKVEPGQESALIDTVEDVGRKLAFAMDRIRKCFLDFDFEEHFTDLPIGCFRNFTFDDLCKIRFSSFAAMDSTVEKLFETRPNHEVVRKIENSIWRWGHGEKNWNEIVDAYNCIRRFSFGISSDFELRLDHTTHYNEIGHSKYSRTFLDGVFAYLVYYKGVRVLTISFSVISGRGVLIQQVQTCQRTGNRWLFKLPGNRLEFVIDLFRQHFPGYKLFIADGKSLVEKSLANYQRQLDRARNSAENYRSFLTKEQTAGNRKSCTEMLQYYVRMIADFEPKIVHLEAQTGRLADFYADCGRYGLGDTLVLNGLAHRQILLHEAGRVAAVAA